MDIAITSEAHGDEVVVSLSGERVERKTQFPALTLYRELTYDDVMTIGKANRVPCSCADGTITLRLPAITAPAQAR
jgi:hypothetical protein